MSTYFVLAKCALTSIVTHCYLFGQKNNTFPGTMLSVVAAFATPVGGPAGYEGNEMAKQQTQTSAPAGNAARKVAQKPSKGVVSKPVDALQAVAATLGATPAPAAVQTPPSVVALRGQAAVQAVAIKAGAVYRTKAVHNMDWWAVITKATATGPATVADLTKAGVPSHFIGYTLRRGYLVAA